MKDESEKKPHEMLWMLEEISTWDHRQLLADLTILSKDIAEYLAPRGLQTPGAVRFWQSYHEVLNHDRWFWEMFEEESFLFKPLFERFGEDLPIYSNEAYAVTYEQLGYLKTADLYQTWTFVKGWEFLKSFYKNLSANMPGIRQAYEQATDKSANERILAIYDSLKKEAYPDSFWMTWLLFVSYLIAWSCFLEEETPPPAEE